jgi:electron transport complex protein RnfB
MTLKKPAPTVDEIDDLLPQTQCGLCDYAGCRPYAEAMTHQKASINKCLPGGIPTLIELAEHFQVDAHPYLAEMQEKSKPNQVAIIREEECIGCTKCIKACPVDAIIGAAKQMHTILTDACTGCELCIPPCPVDCIDLLPIAEFETAEKKQKANISRIRYQKRATRLAAKPEILPEPIKSLSTRKSDILEALQRIKDKKKTHESKTT